jgi:hypothetical protein
MNDEIIKESERYLNGCYTRQSTARHYAHHVKLLFRRCQKPTAELTRQDVDSYVVNELARRLNKAAISR